LLLLSSLHRCVQQTSRNSTKPKQLLARYRCIMAALQRKKEWQESLLTVSRAAHSKSRFFPWIDVTGSSSHSLWFLESHPFLVPHSDRLWTIWAFEHSRNVRSDLGIYVMSDRSGHLCYLRSIWAFWLCPIDLGIFMISDRFGHFPQCPIDLGAFDPLGHSRS
jgi:hypothetical protein